MFQATKVLPVPKDAQGNVKYRTRSNNCTIVLLVSQQPNKALCKISNS